MRSVTGRLRDWWWLAALFAFGWAFVAAGWVLAGGAVMTVAFAVAFYLRRSRNGSVRLGALALRERALDEWFYLAFAVNIGGATLLVTRHLDVMYLAAADAVLALVAGWIVLRPARLRSRPAAGASGR